MNKILTKFQKIYKNKISAYSQKEFPETVYSKPIIYTMNLGRNRFRPVTALVAGKISNADPENTQIIAHIVELIHTVIIIQDDIADNDEIRRGEFTAWKKFGKIQAIFSANFGTEYCHRKLENLNCRQEIKKKIIDLFWQRINDVNKGQILQANLKLDTNIDKKDFDNINLLKAGEGIWAVQAGSLVSGNKEFSDKFSNYAQNLGIAGMIKNDVDDIFLNNNYDSFFCDIKEGIVTILNYYLYKKLDSKEKHILKSYFGCGKTDLNIIKFIKNKLLEKKAYEYCKKEIDKKVDKAIEILNFIPEGYIKEKNLLIDWANNHRI